jgi:hypothetical protein
MLKSVIFEGVLKRPVAFLLGKHPNQTIEENHMVRRIVLRMVFVLIVVTVATSGVSFATEKKSPVKQKPTKIERLPPKEEKEAYSTKPFDTKVTALPAGYTGHDIVALYKRLSKAFPPKDEFESTEAYQRRLQGEYSKDTFAFLITLGFAIYASYDPDAQNILIEVSAEHVLNLDSDLIHKPKESSRYNPWSDHETVINVKRIDSASNKYEAGNKLGAKTVVTEHTGKDYGIGLVNNDSFPPPEKYRIQQRLRNINLKISPDEARDLKGNLGVLLICRVRAGGDPPKYFFPSYYHVKPTMDSPTEISFLQYFVKVDLFEIWVFNRRTGSIYAKDIVMSLSQDQEGIDPNKT